MNTGLILKIYYWRFVMDKKTASWFAYLLSIISAIIVLAMVKDDKEVRTHAWQSLFLSCVVYAIAIILAIITGIATVTFAWGLIIFISVLSYILWLGYLALVIICIIKATQDSIFKIPVVYGWAEKMK